MATNLLLLGAGTLAVGGLGYLAWREWGVRSIPAASGPAIDAAGPANGGVLPAGYNPPAAGLTSPADPLGILGALGSLAGTVPPLASIPGFSSIPGLGNIPGFGGPAIPPYGGTVLTSGGMLMPVLPSDASVTVPNGGQILVLADTSALELQQDVALALALTELYRQQAPTLPGFVAFVAAPRVQDLAPGLAAQLPLLAGGRYFLGTLRAQPGAAAPTYPRVTSAPLLNLQSTILAARRP